MNSPDSPSPSSQQHDAQSGAGRSGGEPRSSKSTEETWPIDPAERRRLFLRRWVWELRHGGHEQTQQKLRDPETGGMCCLGVACNMGGGEWDGWVYRSLLLDFKGEPLHTAGTALALHSIWGITGVEARSLANLNDNEGFSFSQIADYIEANLMDPADRLAVQA